MAHRAPICRWYGVCIINQVRLQGRVSGSQAWDGRRLVMEALCPVKASGITQHNLRKSSKNQGFETRRGVPKTQSSLLFSAPLYFASPCTLTSFSSASRLWLAIFPHYFLILICCQCVLIFWGNPLYFIRILAWSDSCFIKWKESIYLTKNGLNI